MPACLCPERRKETVGMEAEDECSASSRAIRDASACSSDQREKDCSVFGSLAEAAANTGSACLTTDSYSRLSSLHEGQCSKCSFTRTASSGVRLPEVESAQSST